MCSRLGVRQAFSQGRCPQANGRAEAAGKSLRSILRKKNSDNPQNWIEALPRLLKIRSHLATPIVGLSPFQKVIGKEMTPGGLPTEIETRFPAADAFMVHMAELDESIFKTLNEELDKQENKLNKNQTRDLEIQTGYRV